MRLAIIVAMAKNRVIGSNNQLPWHLPEDLKHFKKITLDKPIIMGRKTFDSIGRPLPGRVNIVITRQQSWSHKGVITASGFEQAVSYARQRAADDCSEVMIIGGEEIYRQALPAVSRLYITKVDLAVKGDAYFPGIIESEWKTVSIEHHCSLSESLDFKFEILDKIDGR